MNEALDARDKACAKIRELSRGFKGPGAKPRKQLQEFSRLIDFLRVLTIKGNKKDPVTVVEREDAELIHLICPLRDPNSPLPLRDRGFLKFAIAVRSDLDADGQLHVAWSSYQYQMRNLDPESWVFRYEYARGAKYLKYLKGNTNVYKHPLSHLHVRGKLEEIDALPSGAGLGRVHFPTMRISLESVIRLLVDHFGVKTNTEESIWRPILNCAEDEFFRDAKQPLNPFVGSGGGENPGAAG